MSYVGQLHEGEMLVRLIPVDSPRIEIATPRFAPPRFVEMDPSPPTMVEVDRWAWSGREAEGWMSAEMWVRTFGIGFPPDLDAETMQIPVVWLDYRRR